MKQTDYMVLVNQLHALPKDWYETIETVRVSNRYGEETETEKQTALAWAELKAHLEQFGVCAEMDNALRSIAEQQQIMDDYTKEYGASYAEKTVAPPGYSEHHTGLALDLFLVVNGKDSRRNEDLVQHPEIWITVHELLPEHGFILRYPPGKEHITGYGYEPWHIRYVNDPRIAKEIMRKNITLEGYLRTAEEYDVPLDYGTSQLYSNDQLYDASVQIRCRFAKDTEHKLKSLQYCGDECQSEEALQQLHSLNPVYTGIAAFRVHTCLISDPAETQCTTWILGHTDLDGWDVISIGQECLP